MTRQHSIVAHKANYFFRILEDDYLFMYQTLADRLDPIKEQEDRKLSASSDCKAMIASILENWMNSKRPTAKCEDDLYVYFTIDDWVAELRGHYKRSMIIQCLKEMEEEGEYTDATGKLHQGTIKKRHFVQNTYQYQLNLPVVNAMIEALPEQSPFEAKPHPTLGRPKKSSPKENGIKINGIKKDFGSLKKDFGSTEKDGSTYITKITQIEKIEDYESASADSAPTQENTVIKSGNDTSKQALHIATTDTQTTLLQAEHERETHNGHGSTHHHGAGDTGDRSTLVPLVSADGSGSATGTQAAKQVELSTPVVEKPSRSRKPGKPKEPTVSPERIEAVFDCLDKMARQVTGDASFKYDRSTKASREKVAELLKDKIVTQEALEAVYLELWNTPPDAKTGFDWKNNMSVKAICNNFERVWLSIKGKIQAKQAQTQNGQKVSAAVKAGYTDYTNSPPVEYRPLRMPGDRKRA